MNINSILNQVLGAGQQLDQNTSGRGVSGGSLTDMLQNALGGNQNGGSLGNLGNLLGGNSTSQGGLGGALDSLLGASSNSQGGLGDALGSLLGGNSTAGSLGSILGNSDMLKKLGGGAAAAGILSMLLGGSNGSRGLSGSIAKMGSLAAIGTLAYKAYQSWQQSHPSQTQTTNLLDIRPSAERSPAETENSSRIILKSMITAAAADGQIDQAEQQAILAQVGQESPEAQQWINHILQNPPSAVQIAQEVNGDAALAAEVYLASRIVCGELDRQEIVYLANLQTALGLSDELVQHLEQQAGF